MAEHHAFLHEFSTFIYIYIYIYIYLIRLHLLLMHETLIFFSSQFRIENKLKKEKVRNKFFLKDNIILYCFVIIKKLRENN